MSQTENTIELVSITKIPYVGSGSADRFVKGFKCLKKDLNNLPVTDDMASGSFADALDTGDHAEYSAVTKQWYTWVKESVASLSSRMDDLEVKAVIGSVQEQSTS